MSGDYAYEGLTLSVRHIPDSTLEQAPDGSKTKVDLPGIYQVGVVIDGAFLPLESFHGGDLSNRIEHAKADAKAAKSSESQQTDEE